MTSECWPLIQGTVLRATRVNECGEPEGGNCSTVVTECFVSVAMTDNVEAPDEFKVKNAAGNFCVNQRSRPLLNWIETTITIINADPELFELLTGAPLVLDDSTPPKAVGFGTDTDTYATGSFALEVWTNVGRPVNGAACAPGGQRWGYLLLPWLIEGTIGDLTIENGPVNFTINTITSSGNQWGVGPYDVVLDNMGNPSPLLTPIPSSRHRHLQFTSLQPPQASCGCQPLVLPS